MRTTGDLIIEPRQARDLVITRTFAAPRQLVFDAWTQPELLRQWYGPLGWQLTTCEIDLRAGGRFLFVLQRPNRADMALRGTFQAVDAPTRLATSERWDDDWTGGETTTTTMFDERDGVTTVTRIIEFTSAAARDRALGSMGREGLEERVRTAGRPGPGRTRRCRPPRRRPERCESERMWAGTISPAATDAAPRGSRN